MGTIFSDRALRTTLEFEGFHGKHQKDSGGETFMGISRRWHPNWSGWEMVDQWVKTRKIDPEKVMPEVALFYQTQFWDKVKGDQLAGVSNSLAAYVFDTAVHSGPADAIHDLQISLNAITSSELVQDGLIGPKTLEAVEDASDDIVTVERYLKAHRTVTLVESMDPVFYGGVLRRADTYFSVYQKFSTVSWDWESLFPGGAK